VEAKEPLYPEPKEPLLSGYRRFIITILLIVIGLFALWFEKISGAETVDLWKWCAAFFIASDPIKAGVNVFKTRKSMRLREPPSSPSDDGEGLPPEDR
tara:strand:+ start:1326 stop:1619 length:294 start_codon:yes stop_codon:yes gene_type:complete